jgi:hypothetical protein
MSLLGTRDINNVECEVHASVHGSWTIYRVGDEPGNERFLANDEKSLDGAVNKARQEIKRQQVKVSVPFKTVKGESGIATGFHARAKHKILATMGGKKEQIEGMSQFLKYETPKDVIDHLKDLREEQAKLKVEERNLYNEWKLDLSLAVKTAINEAVEKQAA